MTVKVCERSVPDLAECGGLECGDNTSLKRVLKLAGNAVRRKRETITIYTSTDVKCSNDQRELYYSAKL